MVNGVNNSVNISDSPYLLNEVKSASSAVAVESPSSAGTTAAFALGSAAIFEGVPFYWYYKNNKKLNGTMTQDMVNLSTSTQNALKNVKNGSGSLIERIGQYFKVVNGNNNAYSEVRGLAKAKIKAPILTQKADNAVKMAIEHPEKYPKWKLDRLKNQAIEMKTKAAKVIKPAVINSAEKFGISDILKTSGAKGWLILGGLIEGVTEIYPTFKELGTESGLRQIGKSSVKVAGDMAGFIAGQQLGMAVGSAIGTALFPGVGTAIGGAVGLITGFAGSYLAEKVTSKIVGKSELEIAEEQQNLNKNNSLSITV